MSNPARSKPSGRTALFLYVLLVVLPAACFGLLLWRQLATYQTRLLSELPVVCRDAADRLAEEVAGRVMALVEDEMARPFEEYGARYYHDEGNHIPRIDSPLVKASLRPGVLGYFSFRASAFDPASPPEVQVFRGARASEPDPIGDEVRRIAQDVTIEELMAVGRIDPEGELMAARMEGYGETRLRAVAPTVLNLAEGEEEDECRQALSQHPDLLSVDRHPVHVSYFDLVRADRWGSAVVAVRTVVVESIPIPTLPPCIEAIRDTVVIWQGFVIDENWLRETLPAEEAKRVLGPTLRLASPSEAIRPSEDVTVAEADVLNRLGMMMSGRTDPKRSIRVRVVTDTSGLRREFREQNAWFAGMAGLLTIAMTIGIRLLLASIRQSRLEAERTRNFVASVTHELRTPIAAVKLYGEMLRDGWVSDDGRRKEYLSRIVTESDRLDGLVDRVLLRRRLYDGSVDEVVAGDLSVEVEAQRNDLELVSGSASDDLEFDLAANLPPVALTREGIHVILQNLVENARKYAPVERDADGRPVERILVRTRRTPKGRAVLEVMDRGPGIPEKDRTRVFEAFLRLGDERTRRTKGTGLGLHLVALQARAIRARVEALPRDGGGCSFQVTFRRA